MCGRYATTRGAQELSATFEAADDTGGELRPDYNVAPTGRVPIVRRGADAVAGTVLSLARWGLLPPWAKDPREGSRMINARAETAATSKVFAPCLAARRCLVPADGWYEWVRLSARERQPYFMTRRDGDVLAFAGLWATWGAGEQRRVTCTVLTTGAVGELTGVHHRMPLILPVRLWSAWLDPAAGADAAADLLAAPSPELVAELELRPVGRAVGNVRNNGPALIERVPLVGAPLADAAPTAVAPPDGAAAAAVVLGPTGQPVDLTLF